MWPSPRSTLLMQDVLNTWLFHISVSLLIGLFALWSLMRISSKPPLGPLPWCCTASCCLPWSYLPTILRRVIALRLITHTELSDLGTKCVVSELINNLTEFFQRDYNIYPSFLVSNGILLNFVDAIGKIFFSAVRQSTREIEKAYFVFDFLWRTSGRILPHRNN